MEQEFASLLAEALDAFEPEKVISVRSFEEAMLLTSNAGVVIRLEDGSEYQVTVVKSN